MTTRVAELTDGIFQLSTAGVGARTVNVFLIDAEEPLLFHAGTGSMFDGIAAAVDSVMPVERLRWLSFSHVEADELGAMNRWLARVPGLAVLHTPLGCATSIVDLADRPPVPIDATAVLELGGRRIRLLPTPHVPHNPEAALLFEEVTATLFCSDVGSNDELVRAVVDELQPEVEPVDPAAPLGRRGTPTRFPGLTSITPDTAPTLRTLADLEPRTLAIMHGASFQGDGAGVLTALADTCAARIRQVADANSTPIAHAGNGAGGAPL